ncbi:MAG TPA: ATP-binding cassette domain-containing protein, partial [Burkholderiaceae bacterium]|nr:ATP-binding cassette domain-containing protein [Burkholderiaceae bacterium]
MSNAYILETQGLTKEFRGFYAVRDVSLRIRRNTIHALIGPNGAGKTTCFNLLTTFLRPTAGSIRFDGRDITNSDPAKVAVSGLVRSFQISAVFGQLSVLDNLRVALQRAHGGSFAFWRSDRALDRHNQRAQALLEAVGLARYSAVRAGELSYGRKRALEL